VPTKAQLSFWLILLHTGFWVKEAVASLGPIVASPLEVEERQQREKKESFHI